MLDGSDIDGACYMRGEDQGERGGGGGGGGERRREMKVKEDFPTHVHI